MYKEVKKRALGCRKFQTNKGHTEKSYGLLQPHTVPSRFWEHGRTDFLTEFQVTKAGQDSILVIIDTLSQKVIFIQTTKTVTSAEFPVLFENYLFSKHGVP